MPIPGLQLHEEDGERRANLVHARCVGQITGKLPARWTLGHRFPLRERSPRVLSGELARNLAGSIPVGCGGFQIQQGQYPQRVQSLRAFGGRGWWPGQHVRIFWTDLPIGYG